MVEAGVEGCVEVVSKFKASLVRLDLGVLITSDFGASVKGSSRDCLNFEGFCCWRFLH